MSDESIKTEASSEAEAPAVQNANEVNAVEQNADEVNARNAALSTGKICDDGRGAAFFTSADVRAMSRSEVRANLGKILRSMESPDF